MDFSVKQTLIEKKVKVHGQSPTPEKKKKKQTKFKSKSLGLKSSKESRGKERDVREDWRKKTGKWGPSTIMSVVGMNHDQEFYTCFWITDFAHASSPISLLLHTLPTFLLVPLISLINI